MTDDVKFKSRVAQDAFAQLSSVAAMERDRILTDISASKEHSAYERVLLKLSASQTYQSMLAIAYETAIDVEHKAMILNAQVAQVFGANDG